MVGQKHESTKNAGNCWPPLLWGSWEGGLSLIRLVALGADHEVASGQFLAFRCYKIAPGTGPFSLLFCSGLDVRLRSDAAITQQSQSVKEK